jgi:hypothetical protein
MDPAFALLRHGVLRIDDEGWIWRDGVTPPGGVRESLLVELKTSSPLMWGEPVSEEGAVVETRPISLFGVASEDDRAWRISRVRVETRQTPSQ